MSIPNNFTFELHEFCYMNNNLQIAQGHIGGRSCQQSRLDSGNLKVALLKISGITKGGLISGSFSICFKSRIYKGRIEGDSYYTM